MKKTDKLNNLELSGKKPAGQVLEITDAETILIDQMILGMNMALGIPALDNIHNNNTSNNNPDGEVI